MLSFSWAPVSLLAGPIAATATTSQKARTIQEPAVRLGSQARRPTSPIRSFMAASLTQPLHRAQPYSVPGPDRLSMDAHTL